LQLGVAYNLVETFALEARGGYALSRQNGLAQRVAVSLLRIPPDRFEQTDDFAGLWEMKSNAVFGLRWAPIYGKTSLMSELPVHFQAYVWGGGGAGLFDRRSIVFCASVIDETRGECADWRTQLDRVRPVVSAAAGVRFFTHSGGALKAEVRDYAFGDEYLRDIDRLVAESGGETGTVTRGIAHLVFFELGYAFIF
jgi:outer membrane beta-barrel protein